MSIFGEWVLNKLKQRIYAVSHAKVVVRNRSTVDSDLTDLETRTAALEGSVGSLRTRVTNLDNSIQDGIVDIVGATPKANKDTAGLVKIGDSVTVNAETEALEVNPDVVITKNDLVNEAEMLAIIRRELQE